MITKEILDDVLDMRKVCKYEDDKRDSGLPTEIPEVERINNLQYGEDPIWNMLDIYLPKKRFGKVPVLFNIHGGAFVYGTKETYQFYGLRMAKGGFAFVNFNYRLAPDVEFPGELDDVNKAMLWIVDHAEKYDLDMKNVFIVGDSAGATMAQEYLTILTNYKYCSKFGYNRPNIIVRGGLLNCGVYFMTDPGQLEGVISAYFTEEVKNDSNKMDMLNTENYITANYPPVYLLTANKDFLHDFSIQFSGYLKAKGIVHVIKSYGDEKNDRYHVFNINQKDDIAERANKDQLAFCKSLIIKE